MLVWSTVLPLDPHNTIDKIYGIFKEWLEGSPHSGFRTEAKLPEKMTDVTMHIDFGSEKVDAYRVDEVLGLRYCKSDEGKTWRTELVFSRKPNVVATIIRIYVDNPALDYCKPRVKTPYIVRLLVNRCGCVADGPFPCTHRVRVLKNSETKAVGQLIRGELKLLLPVLFLAPSFAWNQRCLQMLEKWVGGRAHILLAPTSSFVFEVARLAGIGAYPLGSITLFVPGALHPMTLPPYRYCSVQRLMAAAAIEVREATLRATGSLRLDLAAVEKEYNRRVYAKVKKDFAANKVEAGEFLDYADGVMKSQEREIRDLKSSIDHYKAEIDRLTKRANIGSAVPLSVANVSPYYPDELKDAILFTLAKGVTNLNEKGRYKRLISAVLENNVKSDFEDRVDKALHELFDNSKEIQKADFANLERLGFCYEAGNKHHQVSFHGDQNLMWTVVKTGSDHRGGKNAISGFLKLLFK